MAGEQAGRDFIDIAITNLDCAEKDGDEAAGDARRAIALMRAEPLEACETAPSSALACRHWDDVLAAAGAGGQAAAACALRHLGPAFGWATLKSYYGAPAAGLSDDKAVCFVAGAKGGRFEARTYGLLLLLLGPGTLYPPRAHPMMELYYPLAGTAEWKRGNEDWAAKAPGTFIHHPSGVAHATRPSADPMLAFGASSANSARPRYWSRACPSHTASLQAARRPAGRPARPRRRGPLVRCRERYKS